MSPTVISYRTIKALTSSLPKKCAIKAHIYEYFCIEIGLGNHFQIWCLLDGQFLSSFFYSNNNNIKRIFRGVSFTFIDLIPWEILQKKKPEQHSTFIDKISKSSRLHDLNFIFNVAVMLLLRSCNVTLMLLWRKSNNTKPLGRKGKEWWYIFISWCLHAVVLILFLLFVVAGAG